MKKLLYLTLVLAATFFACTPTPPEKEDGPIPEVKIPRIKGPAFSADSAYAFTKAQVDFGPRTPNSPGHVKCGDYIVSKLKSYGLSVIEQKAPATLWNGIPIMMRNIMGQYKPERKDRILLLAHWDTRLIAENDTARRDQPIDGASDGASGVAVLLEIARILRQSDPNIGVDFLFVDAEDNGNNGGAAETWCLGSQYWAQNMPKGYSARYGILLDMVGAKGATFPREGTSVYFAAGVVEKVWSAAANLGYGHIFTNDITGETTDDHYFINQYARIPTIDIVHYDTQRQRYGHYHHTHSDNMDIIDPATYQVVGNVLVDVIYNENPKAVGQ